MDYIISRRLSSDRLYAYYKRRFWIWDNARGVWKESHLMSQKYEREHAARPTFTPEQFMTDLTKFQQLDEFELDSTTLDALKDAKPCKTAPVEPVEEAECQSDSSNEPISPSSRETSPSLISSDPGGNADSSSASGAAVSASSTVSLAGVETQPTVPTFDFGADDQTNTLLLQDAQTFITGNMARIMAAKHAHDLCANNKNGTWGKWCDVVGISRDTGDNMVHIAEQFGNIQIEGKPIFDVQPMKLLYAAAKPSAPQALVEQVKSGDITTYKEYQEVMAQLKAEKARADTAEHQLAATRADINGLAEQNSQLKERAYAAEAREEEAWKMQSKAEARAKNAEDALKKQPITGVIDEEEVDRRAHQQAYSIAADMTTELKADKDKLSKDNAALRRQLAALRSKANDDAQADFESANFCINLIRSAWDANKASYSRLTGEDLETTFQALCGTLNNIMEEASRLCRQPAGHDGGAYNEPDV